MHVGEYLVRAPRGDELGVVVAVDDRKVVVKACRRRKALLPAGIRPELEARRVVRVDYARPFGDFEIPLAEELRALEPELRRKMLRTMPERVGYDFDLLVHRLRNQGRSLAFDLLRHFG